MTYGELVADFGRPEVQDFVDRVPLVYAAADKTPGFVQRSRRDLGDYSHSWGKIVAPKCWGEASLSTAATLSVWESVEAVTAFAYHGAHGDAMRHRNEWFIHNGLPEHVAWWLGEEESPTFEQAAERMDALYERGPTPWAFSLRKPFDARGAEYRIDAAQVKQIAAAG